MNSGQRFTERERREAQASGTGYGETNRSRSMNTRNIAFWIIIILTFFLWIQADQDHESITTEDETKVYIEQEVYSYLKQQHKDAVTEETFCLHGREDKDGDIIITASSRPEIYVATPTSISYNTFDCEGGLGFLHFHLSERECVPSRQDYFVWGKESETHPDFKIEMILCNESYYIFQIAQGGSINKWSLELVEI
jgi:hypothetical protein